VTVLCLIVNYCDVQNPMDIRDVNGVRTDKVPGSRIEYDPFPGGFRIIPGLVHLTRHRRVTTLKISVRSRTCTTVPDLQISFCFRRNLCIKVTHQYSPSKHCQPTVQVNQLILPTNIKYNCNSKYNCRESIGHQGRRETVI